MHTSHLSEWCSAQVNQYLLLSCMWQPLTFFSASRVSAEDVHLKCRSSQQPNNTMFISSILAIFYQCFSTFFRSLLFKQSSSNAWNMAQKPLLHIHLCVTPRALSISSICQWHLNWPNNDYHFLSLFIIKNEDLVQLQTPFKGACLLKIKWESCHTEYQLSTEEQTRWKLSSMYESRLFSSIQIYKSGADLHTQLTRSLVWLPSFCSLVSESLPAATSSLSRKAWRLPLTSDNRRALLKTTSYHQMSLVALECNDHIPWTNLTRLCTWSSAQDSKDEEMMFHLGFRFAFVRSA